jgi:hypothetical protein
MLSDRPFGLVPAHLGFRTRQRRPSLSAETSARETNPALSPPAPAAPAPEPEPAIADSPAAALPSREQHEVERAGETMGPVLLDRPHAKAREPGAEAGRDASKPAPSAPAPSTRPASSAPPRRSTPPGAPPRLDQRRSREISDALELFRACRSARCRHAERCRGEPVACLRSGLEHAPDALHEFARSLISAQNEGLSFEDAFEDAADFHDYYFCWLAGLHAAWRK